MSIVPMLSIVLSLAFQADSAPVSTAPVVAEGVVEAPSATVWDAFTTKEGIESWMVAAGDVDLKIGGLMRTSYRKGADLNGDTAIHQAFLSIDPERMLSWRTVKTPGGFPFAGPMSASWTIVYFDPVDAQRTRVTVKMLGYTTDAESQKMRAFFEVGNKATVDALVKRFGRR